MADAHTMPAHVHGDGSPVIARGTADWLCLAATPTFATMALLTGVSVNDQPDLFCIASHGASAFNGMVMMYALMSVFHVAPWFRLIAMRRA